MKDIQAVQISIETALESLPELAAKYPALKALLFLAPPTNLNVLVSIRHGDIKKSRQVKANAPADTWDAESGIIALSYVPQPDGMQEIASREPKRVLAVAPALVSSEAVSTRPSLLECVLEALKRAESLRSFVSLTWFRDIYLSEQCPELAPSERERLTPIATRYLGSVTDF